MIRRLAAAIVLASTFILPAAANACERPDGKIEFSGGAVAAGVGYSWGKGTLHYQGRDVPITVRGLAVLSVGGGSVEASGEVCNLAKLGDFDGNYSAASAGATLGGGGTIASMENQNGVVITLHSATKGLHANLSLEGVAMKVAAR